MSTWLVLGGAGFLGAHLCRRLLDAGEEVVCVDDFSTGRPRAVAPLMPNRRFTFLRRGVDTEIPATGRADVVAHLASPASPLAYQRLPVQTLRAGSLATFRALDRAEADASRFVLASTSEVYGDPEQHPQTESYWGNVNPVGPRSVYDEAKRFAEAATTAYRDHHGVDTGIVRIFNTFGPGMSPGDGRAVPTFIRQALRGEPLTVAGDGTQTRSLCFVDDTVAGLEAMGRSHQAGPINVGGTIEISVLDLARRIIELTGSASSIRFVDRPQDDPTVRCPDTTRARSLLGWTPKVDIEEGLRRTIAWARDLEQSA